MPDSQNPDHVRKIVREFQLKGQNLIPTVTGEIVPIVMVADLTRLEEGPDDRLAMGGRIAVASGAGNQNLIHIMNPASSGILMIIEAITVETDHAANDAIALVEFTTSFAQAQAFEVWRDRRILGDPIGRITSVASGALVLGAPIWHIEQNTFQTIEMNVALPPNTRMTLRQEQQNTAMNVNAYWRERDIKPGA